jgi:solute carrier family 39 (zinc transporter), member 9
MALAYVGDPPQRLRAQTDQRIYLDHSSFLAGALPLAMSLSQSQLRLLSSIGVGILVGTSLIVIIPEGIEAIATNGESEQGHAHKTRHLARLGAAGVVWENGVVARHIRDGVYEMAKREPEDITKLGLVVRESAPAGVVDGRDEQSQSDDKTSAPPSDSKKHHEDSHEERHMPTFEIGFSLILGFVLMFLIDRLPRHATERFQAAPATRHISLDNLSTSSVNGEEEGQGFLGSLAPSPKQSRSLATTTGLVIHAAADGIAMGASATTANMRLGFIIFIAIMVHKAPAAFGLTSVLLKQGLSKRAARAHLIVFSLAAPFGALATYLLISLLGGGSLESGEWWTGMLLLFSAGTFLYVLFPPGC